MAATSVGNLEIVLAANSAGFVAGLEAAKKAMKDAEAKGNKFGSTLSGVAGKIGAAFLSLKTVVAGAAAAIGVYKLAASLNDAAETVDDLGKASKRLGIGVGQLSALRFAAGEAGVEFESLSGAVGKFNKNIGDALGRGASSVSVGRMAVSLRDVNGVVRPLPVLLSEVATALQNVGTEAEQADIAESLFGRDGGTKFLTLLGEGSSFIENLADQTERAQRLGVIFTPGQVEVLTAYNDAVGRIGEAFLGLRVKLMTELAPALTEMANNTALMVGRIGESLANLAAVIRVSFGKKAWESPREELFAAIKSLMEAVWVNISGYFRLGASRFFAFAGIVLDKVVTGLGTAVQNALITVAETMSAVLKPILLGMVTVISKLVEAITGQIGYAGAAIAEAWQEAGVETAAYRATVQAEMDAANASVVRNWQQVQRLGAEIRMIGDEAPEAAAGIRGVADAAGGLVERMSLVSEPTFMDGFLKQLAKMKQEASEFAKLGEDLASTLITDFAGGMTDALMDAGTSFSNFGQKVGKVMEDIGQSIIKMSLNFMLMRAVTSGLSMAASMIGPYGGQPYNPYMTGPVMADGSFATGAAFSNGRVEKFAAGGVVTRPTLFPMANGTGLMGEAGPEGVLPLERIGGKLGVNAAGAGTIVNVIDQRSGGAAPQVSENQGPDGRRMISVLIRDEVRRGMADGSFDRAMTQNFGLGRRATTR